MRLFACSQTPVGVGLCAAAGIAAANRAVKQQAKRTMWILRCAPVGVSNLPGPADTISSGKKSPARYACRAPRSGVDRTGENRARQWQSSACRLTRLLGEEAAPSG